MTIRSLIRLNLRHHNIRYNLLLQLAAKMLNLGSVWSTRLLYDFLSPQTLSRVCRDEKSIKKYAESIDWTMKSKEKLPPQTILDFWHSININDFLENYDKSYFVTLKRLGVKLTKHVNIILHSMRYQTKLVDEEFAYEFPDFVDFDLLVRRKLSKQFLLDFWYFFNLDDIYKYQNIDFELFKQTYFEEVERHGTHQGLLYAMRNEELRTQILSNLSVLELIDRCNVWHFLPDTITEPQIEWLFKQKNFKNRICLVRVVSQIGQLSYNFIKENIKNLDVEYLTKNETLWKHNIYILKHNYSFYIIKMDSKERINFMDCDHPHLLV